MILFKMYDFICVFAVIVFVCRMIVANNVYLSAAELFLFSPTHVTLLKVS